MPSSISTVFPPKSKFDPQRDIPDLTGRVYLVTGGNTGIGKETSRVLLSKNATVWIGCRSEAKATEAMEDLKRETGNKDVHFLQLDLGNVASVKRSAEVFKSQVPKLHVLINNAGVMGPPAGSKTSDGFEMQWGTNVLGHFTLIQGLLPLLISTAQAERQNLQKSKASLAGVRIVNLTSNAVTNAPAAGVDFSTLRNGSRSGFGKMMEDYGQSKLGNVLITHELARRYKDQGILSFSVHPGIIKTDLQRDMKIVRAVVNLLMYPVQMGALTSLWAATSTDLTEQDNGLYLIPWARRGDKSLLHKKAFDEKLMNDTWDWCERQVATDGKA